MPNDPDKYVEVVIVAFNSGDDLNCCLRSLVPAAVGESIRITIVDNASAIPVDRRLEGSQPPIQVISLTDNLGYAGANNLAIRRALLRQPPPEAVLVLNPDVTLPPGAIGRLCRVLRKHSKCAVVSPGVIDASGIPQGYGQRSLWGVPLRPARAGDGGLIPVDRLPGCCMLIKAEAFESAGLFDENYFLYWEELDFCLRLRRCGYDLLKLSELLACHGRASALVRRHRIYYMWRNQVRFAMKNYGFGMGSVFLIRRIFLANVREAFMYLRSRQPTLIYAGLAGLWAGLRGERGRGGSLYALPDD